MIEFYTRKLFNFSGSKKRVNGSSNVESIFLIAASEMQFWLSKMIIWNQNSNSVMIHFPKKNL
jgi:hypothetical protein